MISIHALREEGDKPGRKPRNGPKYFYPRPPRGGRPGLTVFDFNTVQFLSTPSARRATAVNSKAPDAPIISIHALREEGDLDFLNLGFGQALISIHALREEGD